jgi:cytoskeletal protein CcmA (bactofilin family)
MMWRKSSEAKAPLPASEASPAPAALSAPERTETMPTDASPHASQINSSLTVKGDISGGSDLYFDGEIEGTIQLRGACLTVGPNGRMRADMEAREIAVEGRVQGSLAAHERVHIRRSGTVQGNITAPRLVIEEGAVVRGRISMEKPGPRATDVKVHSNPEESLRPVPLEAGD